MPPEPRRAYQQWSMDLWTGPIHINDQWLIKQMPCPEVERRAGPRPCLALLWWPVAIARDERARDPPVKSPFSNSRSS